MTAKPKSTKTPAVKKTVAPVAKKETPAPRKETPVKKAVTVKTGAAPRKTVARLTPEERYCMVQTAAYFIAERNGFGGCSTDHWAAAEIEIAGKLGE
ncbi:MAG: hypothetical protein A3F73_08735 [Gallionellales bacterium RIFCSPLOWO2_12_FULL_59_22]|nr:MAG: hypothetical protein A3H99_09750 [Gallionellales bacterium RIFCSPLOWO2_02_FULL_59_110]OGT05306.1 MAG: hypothetical protein A2Z65_13510 [Gallionellales bacterium RIFCSPLOWO2_02_58_13]OGT12903.1 MAG: hypothetical protein A3F73_08735 [Gallionellales bacterium RIFCSPLOWO2_12_FULL_59_22]